MHIAWIVYGAIDQPTGGYVYDRLIASGLSMRGHAVRVISIAPGEDVSRANLDADVIVGDELCFREVGRLFRTLARENKPQTRVLLVHHLTRWELEAKANSAVLLGEARALAHAHAVIATSTPTAERLEREGLASDVMVVAPGADRLPRLDRSVRDGSHIGLLFIGSLTPRKGLHVLLRVLDAISDPRVHLVVAGEARDVAYATRVHGDVAASTYLDAHVTFLSVASDRVLAEELAKCDALVLPSTFEGYAMVVAEAIFAGVPVISSAVGAVREIAADAGLYFSPRAERERDLMSELTRFVSQPELRTSLDLRAKERAVCAIRWSDAVTAFEMALERSRLIRC